MNGMVHFRIRLLACFVAAVLAAALIPMAALAVPAGEIIPDQSLWGISRNNLKEEYEGNYTDCEVGKSKALMLPEVDVDGYAMDAYYVFGEDTWDETGYTYHGLSKIAWIWTGTEERSDALLDACYDTMVGSMTEALGEPESQEKGVATWNTDICKVEVGKGKFKKYTGSANRNVAIVVTAKEIIKPVTPEPTPKPTPAPTPERTPKPTKERPSEEETDESFDESTDED